MVKIPEMPLGQAATGARIRVTPSSPAGDMLSMAGGALGGLADMFGALQERKDHNALMKAQNAYTAGMRDYMLKAETERTGGGAEGFTKDYEARADEVQAEALKALEEAGGSTMARGAFGRWAAGRKTVGGGQAALYEHRQLQAHTMDLFQQRVQGITDQLEQNPAMFRDAATELEGAFTMGVSQGLFRPEEAKVKLHDAREKMSVTAFENLYAMDRGKAMSSMAALGLTPAQQAKAKRRYQADNRADAALSRAANAERINAALLDYDDAKLIAQRTGDVSGLAGIASVLRSAGDAKRADKLEQQAEVYKEAGAVRRESYEISLSELRAEIDKGNVEYRPVTEPGAGPEPVGGDADALASRARGLQALQVRQDIYNDRVTALEKDPARAVEKRAALAAEGLGGAALVGARLQAQTADGVAAPKRKALTAAEAAGLAEQWRAADAPTRLTMFRDLEQVYGAQVGRVMGELGLNPLEELAARRAFDDPTLAARLPEISAAAAADGNKLPTVEGFDRLKREVLAESVALLAMRDMLLKVMPGNSDAAGKVRAAQDAAGRLLQLYGGNKEQTINALDKGLGRLEGDRFALLYSTAQVNRAALEDALGNAAWRRLKDFGEALPGYAQDMPAEARADYLRRRGIWANAPDGDGWVLFDARSQAPIINARGEYFRVRPGEVGALSTGRGRTVADENLVWE